MASISLVNTLIAIGAAMILIGILSSLIARRFGVPLLLVFLVLGMLAGQDGPGGIVFNDYGTTYLVGSLALAVILFDGGLRTKLSLFRGALVPAVTLATAGVILTASMVGALAYVILDDWTPLEALLLGAIVASTDAAAVFFLLRAGGLRLKNRIGALLEIESGTNDPIAVFLTILLTELVVAGGEPLDWVILARLAEQGLIGAALGVIGGFVAVALLNRVQMSAGLQPLFVVAAAVLIYAISSLAGGSGLLAAYLAGLVVANRPVRGYPTIVGFHDAATWLSQIVMFLVLGLLVTPTTLANYVVPGLVVALFLAFVARPLAVWICLAFFGFSVREKLFVSWVGLRGAVTIFLATIPTLAEVPHAEVFFNIAFFVVLASLLMQGWTINPLARWLDLALKRQAPSVRRIEVDIPGQMGQEMVGYPVSADSLMLALSRLPSWARVMLVVREGEILDVVAAGALRAGDYVYLLTPSERVDRLDRLFGNSPDVTRRLEPLHGELPLNGEARLADVARLYGLDLSTNDRTLDITGLFARQARGELQLGMRLRLGGAVFVAREVTDGVVTRAGLQLNELVDILFESPPSRLSRWAPGARVAALLARLRKRLRRRKAAVPGAHDRDSPEG